MDLRRAARRLAPAAVLFLLAVVLLAPSTLGGKVLSAGDLALFQSPFLTKATGAEPQNELQFDSAFVFEPDGLLVREAMREGRLPVWTDALSAGRPLLAAQQSAPLYPLTWLSVVFPYWESLAWIVVLKLMLGALGTALLARALGLRTGPALLAGVAFGFGSYMVDWMLHPHTNAYVLLPWLFLAAERLCCSGALRDAALLAGILGIALLGGQPESSLFVSLAAVAWFAQRLLARRASRREAARTAALAVGAAVLGTALAAVMLVPLAEALGEAYATSRAGEPLAPRSGLALFFPEYWGRPDRADSPFGPSNFTERTFYVGVLPVLLAAAGLVVRRPTGPQLFFAGLAVVSLAVALDTGPVTDAVSALPGLSEVNLNRLLVLASFAIAMLAGFGFDRFLSATDAERRRMLITSAVVVALPAVVVLAVHPSWLSELITGAKRLLGLATPQTGEVLALASVLRWLAVGTAGLALLAALTFWRGRAQLLVAAGVGLLALDLLVMGYGFNPSIPKAEAAPPRPPGVKALQELSVGGGRVVGISGLEPNTASRWGLDDARGHEQPVVERHQRLWFALGGGTDGATTAVAGQDPRTATLLDVFGVRSVLLNPFARVGDELPFTPSLQKDRVAYSGPGALVLEHATGLPRAYVAYGWRPSAGLEESIRLMASGTSREALDDPVIETPEPPPAGSAPRATPARVTSRSDTEVVLDVRAQEAGQLVLLDTFYPGWSAELDGRSTPIRAANASFRAIEVPAGRHEVRFSYRPASVVVGGVISIVALLVLIGCLVGSRVASRPRRRDTAGVAG